MQPHDANFGEVSRPGFVGRLLGRPKRILRDANLAAAMAGLPPEAEVITTDPNGHWIVYEVGGSSQVRFCAREAWFPNEPSITPNDSIVTLAMVDVGGRLVVLEGLHRTRATARDRVVIAPDLGGVESAPGWLDFAYRRVLAFDTPSNRAISEIIGGHPNPDLVRAR